MSEGGYSSPDHKQLPPSPGPLSPNIVPPTPMSASSPTVPTSSLVSASTLAQGDSRPVCNGCQQDLETENDQVVVSFGTSLWHVDCRCAKCQTLVEHDTNLLLLSDGSPVCENCSYICSVCSKPISNEAIVTGEESYHADCFRCRSCSNKIEELIFAKTSQGIWCMACHNERVAKSRKKSEAHKRRKEKEKQRELSAGTAGDSRERSSKSRSERDRERSASANAPHHPQPPMADSLEQIPTIDANGRPLPPSPSRSPLPQSESMSTIYGDAHSSLSTPGSTPTKRQPQGGYIPASSALDPSPSNQSLSGIARGGSPLRLPQNHTRSLSNESLSRPTLAERRPSSSGRESPLPSPRPHGRSNEYDWGSNSPGAHASPTLHAPEGGSRQGSLSAPSTDKGQRRRSGFYGAMSSGSRPSFDDGIPTSVGDDGLDEPDREHSPAHSSTSQVVVPPSFLPELHNSVSFYDPDTLLFLDHVGETADSPKRKPTSSYPADVGGVAEDQIERLGSGSGSEYADDDDAGRPRPAKADVARKVRESIQISRDSQGGSEGGVGLDVELVEMLLSELDSTKKEMREIQDRYHAFKRASKSAFEGFSMARDEYDKEVAARRETEARMDKLRLKFLEQAQRLAAVDQEQKQAEALKRQSKELKSTVSGFEKQIKQLKAEVELSVAQVAELATSPSDTVNQSEIVQALNARLEAVKDSHRRDIEALIADRDELAKEIAELKITRESLSDEFASLTHRSTTLAAENADATRKLELLRDSYARLKAAGASGGMGEPNGSSSTLASSKGGQHSSTNSLATGLPPATTRSPLATGPRGPTQSPTPAPYDRDLEHLHRFTKPEAAEPQIASVKKFKWGKSSKVPTEPAFKPQPPGSASKPSPVVPRAGSIDNGVRPHYFQPTSILRPVRCEYCGDKMWGLNEVRCSGCGCYSHTKCAASLTAPCAPGNVSEDLTGALPTGPPMFGNELSAQLQSEGGSVPVVVSKCIGAVEAHGMSYEGIYRKTGGMGQTKMITQLFERGQDFNLEDLDKFNDLAAITSCMKNFFRSLPDPLFTHALHEDFVSCAELPEGESRLHALETTLTKLPIEHYTTAKFLTAHLHRVHLHSEENKMTPANLGVVFGPTILRSSQPSREFSDMGPKAKLVELLVEHHPRLFARPHPAEQ